MNDFISPFILSLKEHQTVNFKTLPYDCIQFSLAVTIEIFDNKGTQVDDY